MTAKRGLGRDEDHRVAWEESYPHPMISCMMPAIAILAIFAAILLGFHVWESSLPNDTKVPIVEGLSKDEAFAQLQRVGLSAEVVKEQRASETVPQDHVLSAEPAGGDYVKTGRLVRLVLSSGSAYTTVPDVTQLPQATAQIRLASANLTVAKEDYINHPTIPFDRVISVDPKPGTRVQKMSSVNLQVSEGPKVIQQPVVTPIIGNTPGKVVKSTKLNVTLPTDGDAQASVRIDIADDDGERTVYQKDHNAGETVVQSVQGTGNVTAKVYYGNRLILTRTF